MASDIMIDMETLSTSPNCVILTIGAVRFDPRGNGVAEKLELRPTIDDQSEKYKRDINEKTVEWWGQQSPEAIHEAFGEENRISFEDCMQQLSKFCWNKRAVWSNGSTFDIIIAENAFAQLGMNNPWPFWNVRDCRTIYDLAKVRLSDGGKTTSHKAVEDAVRQVELVQEAYRILKA